MFRLSVEPEFLLIGESNFLTALFSLFLFEFRFLDTCGGDYGPIIRLIDDPEAVCLGDISGVFLYGFIIIV